MSGHASNAQRVTYDGGYNRTGEIGVMTWRCAACEEERLCLVMDSSEGEYQWGAICQPCANAMFERGPTETGG